jgi:hypothetical protein
MSTASFERSFVFTKEKSVKEISKQFHSPEKITLRTRDYEADKQKGIALLTQRFSTSETR